MDLARGTGHFRTPVKSGIGILESLRGTVSGLAIPHYVIDLPGGKGKVPVGPEYVETLGDEVVVRAPSGEQVRFAEVQDD
jgi:lysine 2,3-aminomutase